jgi:hypothetical protein
MHRPLNVSNCDLYQETDANSAPRFRAEVAVPPTMLHARAYIAGLGYYQLFIDGKKVYGNRFKVLRFCVHGDQGCSGLVCMGIKGAQVCVHGDQGFWWSCSCVWVEAMLCMVRVQSNSMPLECIFSLTVSP